MEEWKLIKDFENYKISNLGNLKNTTTNIIKKPTNNFAGTGYLYCDLYKNNKRKRKYIHRLVAETFIENPLNKPQVNHKDGNTFNNIIENLEWVTPIENIMHSIDILKNRNPYQIANKNREKAVYQIDYKSGQIINRYGSVSEAARQTKIPAPHIFGILKNRFKSVKGFAWQYVELV